MKKNDGREATQPSINVVLINGKYVRENKMERKKRKKKTNRPKRLSTRDRRIIERGWKGERVTTDYSVLAMHSSATDTGRGRVTQPTR